jgi:hypothetical protein
VFSILPRFVRLNILGVYRINKATMWQEPK